MYFVSITRLRIRAWRFLPLFFLDAIRTGNQARKANGNLSMAVLPDAKHTYWTRTVWVDEAAMRKYMSSGAHGKAMRKLALWCSTGRKTQPSLLRGRRPTTAWSSRAVNPRSNTHRMRICALKSIGRWCAVRPSARSPSKWLGYPSSFFRSNRPLPQIFCAVGAIKNIVFRPRAAGAQS